MTPSLCLSHLGYLQSLHNLICPCARDSGAPTTPCHTLMAVETDNSQSTFDNILSQFEQGKIPGALWKAENDPQQTLSSSIPCVRDLAVILDKTHPSQSYPSQTSHQTPLLLSCTKRKKGPLVSPITVLGMMTYVCKSERACRRSIPSNTSIHPGPI